MSSRRFPAPKSSSWGGYSHQVLVCRANRIPHRACRSGIRSRPVTGFGAGTGNNRSISSHSSDETIYGREFLFTANGPTGDQADSHMINSLCQDPLGFPETIRSPRKRTGPSALW